MGFIDKSSLSINAVLTKKGIEYLRTAVFGQSRNGQHVITKFALGDDEIDYGLWDNTPSGSNFVRPHRQIIDNLPVTEPIITDNEIMNSFLFKREIVMGGEPESPILAPPVASFSMRVSAQVIREIQTSRRRRGRGRK
jgi:hypothetical protein